jgi:hypothetical protein
MEMKKILALGIILLFIGVAVAPSINLSAVKASADDDLVEVTTQACGIQRYGNTTVKLTKEQYQDLEQYLVEFRERLNQTSTREEAVPIFKEAVVELNKYGLLLKGMSVEQTQKLVTSGYWHQKKLQLYEKLDNRNPLPQNVIQNQFCFVAGYTYHSLLVGPISMTSFVTLLAMSYFFYYLSEIIGSFGLKILSTFLGIIAYGVDFLYITLPVIPFEIGGFITFGDVTEVWEEPPRYSPSIGWIFSAGLKGVQSINGSFYGTLREFGFFMSRLYVGLSGFVGIVLGSMLPSMNLFFLGSAYKVGASSNPP